MAQWHRSGDQFYAWSPGEARLGTNRSCEHVRTHPVSTAEEKSGEGFWQPLRVKQRTPVLQTPALTQKSRLKANMRYLTPWRQPRAMLQRFSSRRKMKERSR